MAVAVLGVISPQRHAHIGRSAELRIVATCPEAGMRTFADGSALGARRLLAHSARCWHTSGALPSPGAQWTGYNTSGQ